MTMNLLFCSLLTLLSLPLTVVALWSTTIALGLVIFFSFSMGTLEFVGIPQIFPKFIAEFLTLVLFLKVVYCRVFRDHKPINTFGIAPLAMAVTAGIFSGLTHGVGIPPMIFFLRDLLKFYLLFIVLINSDLLRREIATLCTLIVALFAIQLPVSWLKLATHGFDEWWIGTVHLNAGGLSVLLALFAVSFLIAFFWYTQKMFLLILIAFFIGFSIIGEKRATLFFVPMLLFFQFVLFVCRERYGNHSRSRRRTGNMVSIRMLGVTFAIIILAFYFVARTIPSLHPGKKVWGSFNISHIITLTVKYNTRDQVDIVNKKGERGKMGRFRITEEAFKRIWNAGFTTTLFGFGGGVINESYLLGNDKNITFEKFGILGKIPGFAWMLLQAGIVGAICLFFFLARMLGMAIRVYWTETTTGGKIFALGAVGSNLVFIIDYLIYSKVSLTVGVLTPIFFFVNAFLYKKWKQQYVKTTPSKELSYTPSPGPVIETTE